jgi:hypothetical protein
MPNLEALKQLRRVAVEAPDDRFNMASWCEDIGCQTVMCLAGWAAIDPWHRQNTSINVQFYVYSDMTVVNTYECLTDDFLAEIYGIDSEDAQSLFAIDVGSAISRAVTKVEVIDNIDRLLAGLSARRYGTDMDT